MKFKIWGVLLNSKTSKCQCLNADANVWMPAFKHWQPIFEWVLLTNWYDYTLPEIQTIEGGWNDVSSLLFKKNIDKLTWHNFFHPPPVWADKEVLCTRKRSCKLSSIFERSVPIAPTCHDWSPLQPKIRFV